MSDEPKQRVSASLDPELVEMLDGAVADAPDYLSLSRSELLGHYVRRGADAVGDDVLDLIPDELLAKFKAKDARKRIKAEHYVIDLREGWRGRTKTYLNKRLAGEEPYHPEGVEVLAQGYRQDLERIHALAPESARSLEDDLDWLDDQLAAYRDAFRAKQTVPDSQPFESVDNKIETGRDLLSLRGDAATLVERISAKAESQAFDPDAIVRSLAAEFAVSETAIETVLDVLLPDDVDTRQALKSLESTPIEEILPPEAVEQVDSAEVPEIDGEISTESADLGSGDLATETLSLEADELPGADDPEIDAEKVEAIVTDTIRATDGGEAGD